MDTSRFLQLVDRPLPTIELAELRATRDALAATRSDYERRLIELEARQQTLFEDGASRKGVREQKARALQIAGLDGDANRLAALMRLTHKQLLLVDRLIWLRENLDTLERLRDTPGALPPNWQTLLDATEALDEEARLDKLNAELGGAPQPPRAWPAAPAAPDLPRVTAVLDGATIDLDDGRRVRYIGVDAPGITNVLGQPDIGAMEAREANRALVEGQHVRLAYDSLARDADGAHWCYVYLDNRLVNAELIKAGVAYYVDRYPNNRHAPVLIAAEREARRRGRGLWKSKA